MSSLGDYLRAIPGAHQIKRALTFTFTDVKTDLTSIKTDHTYLVDRLHSQALSSAGLVIKTGGSALVKTGSGVLYAVANGVLSSTAAATDMPALVGSVTNAKYNVFCFFVDSAAVVTVAMGTEAATLAAVAFPAFPANKACLGFIIVNPTGTGPFVGGTTALDDATVVPNVKYVNTQGAFDPKTAQTFTAVTMGA